MKTISKFLTIALFAGIFTAASAQDIHFSQFSASPVTLNPATTGAYTGTHRIIVNFKEQWKSVTNPYTTFSGSYDAPISKDLITDGALAGGIAFFSDKAGDLDFSTNAFIFSLAANKSIDQKNNFSLGIQGGLSQRGISSDASSQEWGNQYIAGSGFDPNAASGETAVMENFMFGDFSAGFLWRHTNDVITAHLGFAGFHLNTPKQNFYAESEKLHSRITAHGGVEYMFGQTNFGLIPQFLFMKQGEQMENNMGMLAKYVLDENLTVDGDIAQTAVYLGGWYRLGDAAIANIRFDHRNMSLGISYDINLSSLKIVSSGQGGLEIALSCILPIPPPKRKVKRSLM